MGALGQEQACSGLELQAKTALAEAILKDKINKAFPTLNIPRGHKLPSLTVQRHTLPTGRGWIHIPVRALNA